MPLPEGGQAPWPPKSESEVLGLYREHAAWYSGDPARLAAVYATGVNNDPRATAARGPWWRYWGRAGGQPQYGIQQRAQLHVPLAGELAATSSALLFTEAPDLTIPDARPRKLPDGSTKQPDSDRLAAQDRLETLVYEGQLQARLLEAGETGAAIGGVYLRVAWDEELADYPFAAVVQADQAIPEFSYGFLKAVTLHRELRTDGRAVIRHLERHERGPDGKGLILHGLYRGTVGMIGDRMSDGQLRAMTGLESVVALPFTGIGIRYVPNMRPNRRWRDKALGQSDYAGSEGLLDALDETWASWQRDIRLGKARIMVPEDLLLPDRRFDLDHEVFTPLDVASSSAGTTQNIVAQQFEIRVEQHRDTALSYLERIVSNAGWSPQTFGLNIEGRAESGTALRVRESKTYFTRERKAGWFVPAIADLGEMLLAVDRFTFGHTEHGVYRPDVALSEGSPSPGEVASTMESIRRAEAASTDTLVRMLHPDWDDDRVAVEVAAILMERGLSVPNPSPGDGPPEESEEPPPPAPENDLPPDAG